MKIRILHLIESSEPGGAETVLINIAKSLNKRKCVSILGISGNGLWLRGMLKGTGLKIIQLERKRPIDLSFLVQLTRVIGKENIMLIHSHMFTMNFYGTLASILTRTPIICTMHDTCYDLATKKRIALYKGMCKTVSGIVTVSPDMYEQVRKKICDNSKIKCILNGVIPKGGHSFEKHRLRSMLNISNADFLILYVGNLHKVKNPLILTAIAKHLTKHIKHYKIIIIGEGTLRPMIEKTISRLSLQNNVLLLGIRNDVPDWLSVADTFVLPSQSEGLSISLLEAMSYGLPVIASAVGGNKDVITNNENGILVGANRYNEYVTQIVRLYKNPELRDHLGRNAMRTVKEQFNVRQMVQQYEELYERSIM